MRSTWLLRAALAAVLLAVPLTAPARAAADPVPQDDPSRAAIQQKYTALGGGGTLGEVVGTADGGRYAEFAKWGTTVTITWRSDLGAHWFSGAFRQRWIENNRADGWGHAMIDQEPMPGGTGEGVKFSKDVSVYYSPSTGARALTGAVRAKYWQLGSVTGIAGYPITDALDTPDGAGRFADFQNYGLSIYASHATGVGYWMSGAVRQRFRTGGDVAAVGFPTSDQLPTPGRDGVYVLFGPNRAIIYGPQTGARLVSDAFLTRLRADGDVAWDGLPKLEQTPLDGVPGGTYQHFQAATIIGTPAGAVTIRWDIREAWWRFGGTASKFRLPTANEIWSPDRMTVTQTFEGGHIQCGYHYAPDGNLAVTCTGRD
ncbi:MAG TPA: hypothetical protein VGX25_01000 [Actinophytocola sp.]|uniref:hypothetical protein n=1 Tax=Actinophytocola sp. TaxID=1872138 RepID=UPI002DDD6D8B|nr:hypothetical protein [Actinophytocola sp.]HEV2777954.1 hypothetical protein [Actinophytocola sp.]